MAKLLGRSPFDASVLSLTDPQLDWMLAQHEIDYPPPPPDPVKDRFEEEKRKLFGT